MRQKTLATSISALVLTAVLGALSSPAHASSSSAGVSFHSSVKPEQRDLLAADLMSLGNLKFSNGKSSEPLSKFTGLKSLDGIGLHNWIINRSRYIVGEDFDVKKGDVIDGGPLKYEAAAVSEENEDGKVSTDMINIGTILYLHGKSSGHLLGIDFDGTTLFFTSPRVGLIKIGGGLFQTDETIGTADSPAYRLRRLGILSHESRHSDGHGASIGFKHVICPAGHAYEGMAGCDRAANGPYSVGAAFLAATIDACKGCTDLQKEALRAEGMDYSSRLVSSDSVYDKMEKLQLVIGGNEMIIESLTTILNDKKTSKSDKAAIKKEVAHLKQQNEDSAHKLMTLSASLQSEAKSFDSKPEGKFISIPLEKSKQILKKVVAPSPLNLAGGKK